MSAKSEKDWQTEMDLDTLRRAAEIKADKSRYRAAMGKLKEQRKRDEKMMAVAQ